MQSSNILLAMELPCATAISCPKSVLAREKQSKRSPAQLCSVTEAQSKSFKIKFEAIIIYIVAETPGELRVQM